jgi:uncharacterized Zn finger protein (UPF0148 family)
MTDGRRKPNDAAQRARRLERAAHYTGPTCPRCLDLLPDGARYCPECGTRLMLEPVTVPTCR